MLIAFTGVPATGRGVVQLPEPARRNTDAGSIPQFPKEAKDFLPESTSHCTLLRCSYNPRVHAVKLLYVHRDRKHY